MKKKLFVLACLMILGANAHAQSSNVTLEGKWLQGLDNGALCTNGNYTYYATDSILYVLDVSNPPSIKGLSQIRVGNPINWISVVNSKAYLALGDSGLCIVDVSNPYFPVKLGSCLISGEAYSVKVSGNYAYVAADTAGMRIIDISNPYAPVEVGFYNLGSSNALNVDIAGNFAYIAYGTNGLRIVDISNPVNPIAAGFLPLSFCTDVFVSGNHAYVAAGYFYIVNITNPGLPVVEYSSPASHSNFGIFVLGNLAYIYNNYSPSYEIYNISNPTTPALIGSYSCNGMPPYGNERISVSNNTAYFLRGGTGANHIIAFDIVNVSNPSSPFLIGRYNQPRMMTAICTSGHFAYAGEWTPPGMEMVSIFDIADPAHPQQVSIFLDTMSVNFGTGAFLFLSGNYLYLSGTRTGPGNAIGFKIIDISNPSTPFKAGSFNIPNASSGGIAVQGNFAYVCYGTSGMVVVDVSNPAAPVQSSSLVLSGGFQPQCIFVSGHYAYITDNAIKLHIIDIANPASPVEVGSYTLPVTASDLYTEGNYAYVALGMQGFQIIDVSNPSAPFLTGNYPAVFSDSRVELYKYGNNIYLADFINGMQVIDVSNHANPVQTGYYFNTGAFVRNVFADSLHSYLATDIGMYIFNGGTTSVPTIPDRSGHLILYPNPVNDKIMIPAALCHFHFTIREATGQVISEGDIDEHTQAIYTGHLSSGFYLITFDNGKEKFTDKFIRE